VLARAQVNAGQVQADQSGMTGESLPVTKYPKDLCFMGSTITRGETEGTVAYTGKLTFFGKTASMLNQADGLGNLQKILLKIMFVLVVLSLTLCGITLIYLTVHKGIDFRYASSASHWPACLRLLGPWSLQRLLTTCSHSMIWCVGMCWTSPLLSKCVCDS
jgi:magnesium-transporting ATPase (P-type)